MKFRIGILSAALLVANTAVVTTADEVADLIEAEQEIITKLNSLQMKSSVEVSTTNMTTAASESDNGTVSETKRQFHKEKKLAKAEKLNEEMNLLASSVADTDEEAVTTTSNEEDSHHHHSHNHSATDAKASKDNSAESTTTASTSATASEVNNVKAAKATKNQHSTSTTVEKVQGELEEIKEEMEKIEVSEKIVSTSTKPTKAAKAKANKAHDTMVTNSHVLSHSLSHSMSMSESTAVSHNSKAAKKLASKTHATTSARSHSLSYSLSHSMSMMTNTHISKSAKKRSADTTPTKPVVVEYTEKPETEDEVKVETDDEEEQTEPESEDAEDDSKEVDESASEEDADESDDEEESEQVPRVGSDPALVKDVESIMLDGLAMNNHMNKQETMNSRTDLKGKVMAGVEVPSSGTARGASGASVVGGAFLLCCISSIVYNVMII